MIFDFFSGFVWIFGWIFFCFEFFDFFQCYFKQSQHLTNKQMQSQFIINNVTTWAVNFSSLQSRPQIVWFSHEQQPISVAAHEGLEYRLQLILKKLLKFPALNIYKLLRNVWSLDLSVIGNFSKVIEVSSFNWNPNLKVCFSKIKIWWS